MAGMGVAGLIAAIVTNLIIATVFILLFCKFRSGKATGEFYNARILSNKIDLKPRALPNSFFGWMKPLFTLHTDDEILQTAGLDGLTYIRIIRFAFQLFVVLTFLSIVIILPVNVSDSYVEDVTDQDDDDVPVVNSLDILSLTNIKLGSPRLWAHILVTWIISCYAYYLLWSYQKRSIELRIKYVSNLSSGPSGRSVFTTDLPLGKYGGAVLDMDKSSYKNNGEGDMGDNVMDRFRLLNQVEVSALPESEAELTELISEAERLLGDNGNSKLTPQGLAVKNFVKNKMAQVAGDPSEVEDVAIIYDTAPLDPFYQEYLGVHAKLERLVDTYNYAMDQNKKIKKRRTTTVSWKNKKYGEWGERTYGQNDAETGQPAKNRVKADLLVHLTSRLEELRRILLNPDTLGAIRSAPSISTFVTFASHAPAVVGSTSLIHHDERFYTTQMAPESQDIIWQNVRLPPATRTRKSVTITVSTVLLALFFSIPVAFVQGLMAVETLESWPGIGAIVAIPPLRSFLAGFLPGFAFVLFLILLPIILGIFGRIKGLISNAEVDNFVVKNNYAFQVIVVFLMNLLAKSLLNQLLEILADPLGLPEILATAVPNTSEFFISYILVQTLSAGPAALLNIVGLIIYLIINKLSPTQRAKQALLQGQKAKFGSLVPKHSVILLIGLVFAPMQPIVPLLTLLYFGVQLVVAQFKTLYCLHKQFEGGGQIWVSFHSQVICGLLVMQITMMAIIGLKEGTGAPLLLPLPFATLIFNSVSSGRFRRPLETLSLMTAQNLRAEQQGPEGGGGRDSAGKMETFSDVDLFETSRYDHPMFKLERGKDFDMLLVEARETDAKLTPYIENWVEEEKNTAGKKDEEEEDTNPDMSAEEKA